MVLVLDKREQAIEAIAEFARQHGRTGAIKLPIRGQMQVVWRTQ